MRDRFQTFFASHGGIVGKIARVYARDPEARRDLEQEIATQAWRAYPSYDEARRRGPRDLDAGRAAVPWPTPVASDATHRRFVVGLARPLGGTRRWSIWRLVGVRRADRLPSERDAPRGAHDFWMTSTVATMAATRVAYQACARSPSRARASAGLAISRPTRCAHFASSSIKTPLPVARSPLRK